ncbi:helix-turn-helix domain-containing protein [Micromonospora sp. NPDC003197]
MPLRRQSLAQRRKAVGHTQESLADRLGVDRTTVVRWERAESEPQPWVRRGLAQELQVSVDELAQLLADVAEIAIGRPERLTHALKNPRSADLATAAQLQQTLAGLTTAYSSVPSTALLTATGRLHAEVSYLRSNAHGEGVKNALCVVESESALLMGQLIWDASQRRDCATAATHYKNAISMAQQGGSHFLQAYAWLRKSYISLYGAQDHQAGLSQASLAAQLAARANSNALSSVALLHVGEAYAMLGDQRSCERTLSMAESQLSQIKDSDPGKDYAQAHQLERLAGSCYLSLGKPVKAQQFLQPLLSHQGDQQKVGAIAFSNLSLALVRQHQIQDATVALHYALDLTEQTRGGGALNVIFKTIKELQPWRDRVDVNDVQDRALTLISS